ncbi:MAG: hypothetical protein GF320_21890 [Armatimonadia bacterium]|nr:hypothetical protein [Armatimonadia bacterium]
MPYDFHGYPMRAGHCEAHPDIRDEYPCWACEEEEVAEANIAQREYEERCYRELEAEYAAQADREYYRELAWRHFCDAPRGMIFLLNPLLADSHMAQYAAQALEGEGSDE